MLILYELIWLYFSTKIYIFFNELQKYDEYSCWCFTTLSNNDVSLTRRALLTVQNFIHVLASVYTGTS